MQHKNHSTLATAIVLGFSSGLASAAGFQLLEQNLSGLGNAYAGSAAVAENASTIFFNPAGMTQLKDHEFTGGLAAIGPSFKFTDNGSNVGLLAGTGNGGDAGVWGYVPNAYLSWALNKDLYIGAGFSAPFGLKTEYANPWLGAAQATSFSVETMNFNPSIAYRVNEAVSVGGGLNWQHIDAVYKRQAAVASALTIATPITANLYGDTWGWNAGAMFNVAPTTKVGVSYRSAVSYDTTGDINLAGPNAPFNASRTSNIKASIKLPDTAIASVTQQLNDKWQLLGDVSWTGWSSISKLDLVRTSGPLNGQIAQTLITDFRDTWRVAVGANYQYTSHLKLKFGLGLDQTPVKAEATRLVSLPDNDRTEIAAGAQWKLSGGSTLDLGLAYLMIDTAPINNNQVADGRGLVKGSYSGSAWILGVQYSMPF